MAKKKAPASKKSTAKKATLVRKAARSKFHKKKVPAKNCFILVDGSNINNLMELVDALDVMDDSIFYHHVTEDRNDFSNWIKDIIKEAKLAEAIAASKNKHDTQKLILRYIVQKLE